MANGAYLLLLSLLLRQVTFAARIATKIVYQSSSKKSNSLNNASCTDLCIKCDDPTRRSILVHRSAQSFIGRFDCTAAFVISSMGDQEKEQHLLVNTGVFGSSGTKKLRKASTTESDKEASGACDKLKTDMVSTEELASCAAHSLLCGGPTSAKNVVGMFSKALPTDEKQCAALSSFSKMPQNIMPFIVDEDENEENLEPKVSDVELRRLHIEASIQRAPLSDCKDKKRNDAFNSCETSNRCAWDESTTPPQCVALCDHPRMRDSEAPCSSQTHCHWNAERHNPFTIAKGLCEYRCPGKNWMSCGAEEFTRASDLHGKALKKKKYESSYEWISEHRNNRGCYDPELMEEQLRFDWQRSEASVARVCDYEHDQSFVHQYFKHADSVNCFELPAAEVGNVSAEVKQKYLQAGCWPFARVATSMRTILNRIRDSLQVTSDENEQRILRKALDQENLLQRLAKYSFGFGKHGSQASKLQNMAKLVSPVAISTQTPLAARAAMANAAIQENSPSADPASDTAQFANSKLFAEFMAYIYRAIGEHRENEIENVSDRKSISDVREQASDTFLRSFEDQLASATTNDLWHPRTIHDKLFETAQTHLGEKTSTPILLDVTLAYTVALRILPDILDTDDLDAEPSFSSDELPRRMMQCIPTTWGRIGFATGGMRNDGNYLDIFQRPGQEGQLLDERSNRFTCSIGAGEEEDTASLLHGKKRTICSEVCVEEAQLSGACSRVAVSLLNFWIVKLYSAAGGFLNMAHAPLSKCLSRSEASSQWSNCWLYQSCMKTVISEGVCLLHPDCCAGDLIKWRPLARGIDKIDFRHNLTGVPDTPSVRFADLCEKYPEDERCF